jgi:hypothetical protein
MLHYTPWTEMPRELICSVASDDTESAQIAKEIFELQTILRARGEKDLHCSEPVHYVCFISFEITRLSCVDASVFAVVQTWWTKWHPYSPCCIVRATSKTKLSIYCPRTGGGQIDRHRATIAFVLSRIIVVAGLAYLIYSGFYCKYKAWINHILVSAFST